MMRKEFITASVLLVAGIFLVTSVAGINPVTNSITNKFKPSDYTDVLQAKESSDEAFAVTFVSKTEYVSGEQGQVIIRVTDFAGNLLQASCNVQIYNPDKSVYQSWTLMSNETNGNKYYTFTVPTTEGVYEDFVNCSAWQLGQWRERIHSSSFHVNPALNTIMSMNQTLYAVNMSVQDKLNTIVTDLSQFNMSLFDYLDATNQTYTQFFQAISNNQTYWFPLIYNDMTLYLPVINQTSIDTYNLLVSTSTDIQSNFSTVIDLLNQINQSTQEAFFINIIS